MTENLKLFEKMVTEKEPNTPVEVLDMVHLEQVFGGDGAGSNESDCGLLRTTK